MHRLLFQPPVPLLATNNPVLQPIKQTFYCFFVPTVHLPVEAGYGCLVLVASNVFVRTKPFVQIAPTVVTTS
jgi:hypothetical protein